MPAAGSLQESVHAGLREQLVDMYTCDSCGGGIARQQVAISDLSDFLIIHVKKVPAQTVDVTSEPRLRLCGQDFQRFAVIHHSGDSPCEGHYTATVSTREGTYHCDDYVR